MFKPTVAASLLGAVIFASAVVPASAEESAFKGNTPGIQCANATEQAARIGTVSEAATLACKHALNWSHFIRDERGQAYSNVGVLHLIQGQYQLAIVDFDAALRQGVEQSSVLNDRGLAQAALHNYQAARDDYSAALSEAKANRERIYFNRAMAEEDLGNMKAAYLDYRKATELAPNWDKAAKELSRFTVAHPMV